MGGGSPGKTRFLGSRARQAGGGLGVPPRRRGPDGGGGALKPGPPGDTPIESVRLDVWLDVACVFPTRSQAKAAIEGGKVDVNGARAKPHREIRAGDRLTVTTSRGDDRILVVRGLASRSIPKAEARKLYEDATPPPPPEVAEARRLDRMLAPRQDQGKPDRNERRERRERKGWR